jgi:hypothetical protein
MFEPEIFDLLFRTKQKVIDISPGMKIGVMGLSLPSNFTSDDIIDLKKAIKTNTSVIAVMPCFGLLAPSITAPFGTTLQLHINGQFKFRSKR